LKLTPLEIKKQRFKTRVRGYDTVEVESFLEMIANEYESFLNERNHHIDEITKLKTQLKDYQQVEKTLQETLMNAQETVSQSRENSKREAQIILREAELKAERILDEAKDKLENMRNEYAIMKAQKESFTKRLKHLLNSQIELIQVLEIDDEQFVKRSDELSNTKTAEKGRIHRTGGVISNVASIKKNGEMS
jgi:cell division initiation protein